VTETASPDGIGIDDAVLVERCRTGDSAAMGPLILKYQNRIYNVILKMCRNADDAAELTQETFVKIIESIDRFEARSAFYTWAFRIAVNLTLNHCQRTSRFGSASLDYTDESQQHRHAATQLRQILSDESSPDPAVVAQNRELCDLVINAIDELDEPQRTVLVLRDIEGMNYAQIAQVIDAELGTVKSRLSRARSNLRQILERMVQ